MWPYYIDERIRAFALKRIHRDLHEANASTLPGLSICMPDSQNPYLLHANIKIQDGIYKDILIHVIIRLPENYPHSAPAANIAPGHPFTEDFHEHIIGKSEYGAAICTDLLSQYRKHFDNFTIYGKRIISGWTPAYTLSSILLQLQVFFANHDLPETRRPTPSQIQAMKEKTEKFTFDIMVSEGNFKKVITHSYAQPYPPFNEQAPQSSLQGRNEEPSVEESEYDDLSRDEQNEYFDTDLVVKDFQTTTYKAKPKRVHFEEEEKDSMLRAKGKANCNNTYSLDKRQISNKLVCPITRQTIFDEPMPTFGYLMLIDQDRFKRLHVIPVIELNSKEGIQHSTGVQRLASYSYYHHISTYGNRFNFWMPLYINEKHYEQSQYDVEEAISIIYNRLMPRQAGPESFYPKMVLKVLPPILVKTIIHILKWNVHQSLAALDAYCQFYWLFMKLVNKYPEIQQQIDEEINMFLTQEEFRHKKKVGDLGEFMFKLSLSSQGIYNTEVNKALLGEFFTRQVTWAKKRNPELRNYSEVENLVPTFLGASKIACQFFLVQFETAKLMVNDSVQAQLEEGYGFVNPVLLDQFMEKVYWIRDNMRYNWRTLVDNIGLGHVIRKKGQVEEMIRACFEKESQLYSEWTVVQCKTLYIGLEDPRKPKFGYPLISLCQGNLSIQTDLFCDLTSRVLLGDYWLPIYINKEHFERLKDTYNTQIMSIRSAIGPFDAEKTQIAECAIKVFTFVLVHCFDNLCSGRRPVQDFIAYIQILWSFWKLLEHNGKMRDRLNEEVDLFQRDKLYREGISWENLPEMAIKFVLSENGRSDPQVWNCLFEELVRKYTVEAAKIIDGNNYKEPNCSKFGYFKEFPIKYILAQIELARTVLNDQYRVQLENNNGFLKEHDIQDVRSNFLQPMNHDAGDLWNLLLRVLNIKGKIDGFETMSNEIQEKLRQVKKKEQTGEIVVDKLGSQFVVKMDKKKKNKKKQVTE